MKITIIGSGNIGSGLAVTLGKTAHTVYLASRDEESVRSLVEKLAQDKVEIYPASIESAVKAADVVILAVPYPSVKALAEQVNFAGKVVVDVTNPVREDFSGLSLGFDTSAAEEIQQLLPQARVVKAFNTVFAQIYQQGLEFDGRQVQTFVAADDDAAKQTVLAMATDAGFDAVDAGVLTNARFIEPLAYLNIHLGYMLGRGTQIAPAWFSRSVTEQ